MIRQDPRRRRSRGIRRRSPRLHRLATPSGSSRFLDLTGLTPDTVREAASSPGFFVAVLDHLAADELLLLTFATNAGVPPARVLGQGSLPGPMPWVSATAEPLAKNMNVAAKMARYGQQPTRPEEPMPDPATPPRQVTPICRDCLSRGRAASGPPMRRVRLPSPAATIPELDRSAIAHVDCDAFYRRHREARRSRARRQAGDRRRRQARRRLHGLLYRAHLRRALGHADVQGAGGLPRGRGDQARHREIRRGRPAGPRA